MPFAEGMEVIEAAFPHMSCVECSVAGMPARLFRASFIGEVGFDVDVAVALGRRMWERRRDAGRQYGIVACRSEAMHVMQAEKGHVVVGQDTGGMVTPLVAGMGRAVCKKKPGFVGRRRLDLRSAVSGRRMAGSGRSVLAPTNG